MASINSKYDGFNSTLNISDHPLRMSSWYFIETSYGLILTLKSDDEDAGVRLIGYHDTHGGDNQRFTFERSTIRSELNSFVFDACGCPMVEKTSRSILSKSDRDTLMISCFRADG